MEYIAPEIRTGCDGLADLLAGVRAPLICAAPEPWAWLESKGIQARAARIVENSHLAAMETVEASLPSGDLVVGIGGGTAVDNAKYVAWKRHIPLVTMPSAISADAFLTSQIAVREKNLVKYMGDVWPSYVVVDYELIQTAPKRLNTAGAADILSIHTALHDWKLASEDRDERYHPGHAQEAREILVRLELAAPDIAAVNQRGIDRMVDLYAAEVELCARNGNSRPEEGSEHLFAYNFERVTGKHLIHGELVGTGIWLLSRLQENQPAWVTDQMTRLGIRFRPAPQDMSRQELRETLATLQPFVREAGMFYSVIDRSELNPDRIDDLLDELLGD